MTTKKTKKAPKKLDDPVISVADAMALLNMSRENVQALCRDGWIKGAYPLTVGWAMPRSGVIAYRESERYQSRERWRRAAATAKANKSSSTSTETE